MDLVATLALSIRYRYKAGELSPLPSCRVPIIPLAVESCEVVMIEVVMVGWWRVALVRRLALNWH